MKSRFVLGLIILSSMAVQGQTPVPSIPGWKKEQQENRILFTPATLLPTNFTYSFMLPTPSVKRDLPEWLKSTADSSLVKDGFSITDAKSTRVKSFELYTVLATDNGKKRWTINYVAYELADHRVRYARIMFSPGTTSPYSNAAIKHFMSYVNEEDRTAGRNTGDAGKRSTRSGTEVTRKVKVSTPVKGAELGLTKDKIQGIVIHAEYTFGVGGMMITEYRPYLMLKDGTAYQYPEVNPYDLDVEASKKVEVEKWGTWKQSGKSLMITLPEKGVMTTDRWDENWFWAKPAASGEKIVGGYKMISGGGNTALGGTAMVFSAGTIYFNDKGQFTMERTGGGSNSAAGVSVSAYASKQKAGVYTLEGYGAELRYNDGKIVRKLLYFYPDSKRVFGLGDEAYTPVDKQK